MSVVHPSRRDPFVAGAASAFALAGGRGVRANVPAEEIVPFTFRAPEEALSDLKRRLRDTRWPEHETASGWEQGPPLAVMRNLANFWFETYDWRKGEAELSRWPQFTTRLDGLAIHFIHVRSRHKDALPIILTHGWPSTILLFRHVIAALTDPTAHGGTASDAFDVVIPSLPGFAFSEKPVERGWNAHRIARVWASLMQRLGYRRYVAQGGDWGAYVTTALAQQRAPGLTAIHLNFAQTIPDVIPQDLLPDQQRAIDAMKTFREKNLGYAQLQSTRPQLLGYALADSPVGQAAWIYDIFNGGTGNTGHPEDALSRNDMLDEITFYWLTDTAASSARIYLEQAQLLAGHNNPGQVDLPVGVSVFPHDLPAARSWAPLVYPRLFYWNELDRGGHFAQLEVPELFTEELRRCFRSQRAAA